MNGVYRELVVSRGNCGRERRLKTENILKNAIESLSAQGIRVTAKAVAELTGISRATIYRNKHLFSDGCVRPYVRLGVLDPVVDEERPQDIIDELLQF